MSSFTGLDEIENLRLFLQERVAEFDASVDTSTGSQFDNEVIQPLLARLGPDPFNTDLETFARTKLAQEFPDLVSSAGEPIDDLVIKPMRVLLNPFRRQVQQVSNNQSLANPSTLNEAEADNLAGNYFVRRQRGGFSVGVVRLYFSAPQFALVTPSNPASTTGGLQFFPVENQSITASNMLFNEEDNLFFFDIVVRAEEQGDQYNVEPGTINSIDGLPQVVKVTNKARFEEGAPRENTETFIARVEQSLTEKSLVTTRGIFARLTDVFESISLVQVIGFGDIEMNRDIITGTSQAQTYAVFFADTPSTGGSGTPIINLDVGAGGINTGDPTEDDFLEANVGVGDIVTYVDQATQALIDLTVTDVVDGTEIRVTPNVADGISDGLFLIRRPQGLITISGIPGGILQPTTPQGTIQIPDNEVHIGGGLDVFIRAGQPQENSVTIEGVLDANPLRFDLDLETFGDESDRFSHVSEKIVSQAWVPAEDRVGNAVTDHVLVFQFDVTDDTVPWEPTEDDVGRYLQFLGPASNFGTFEILEIIGEQYAEVGGDLHRAVRIKIDLTDLELDSAAVLTSGGPFDVRIVESVSIKDRLRDRDGSTTVIAADVPVVSRPEIVGGVDFIGLGIAIGDSVVIETGDDAGIYSIRRILSWLNDNDTLIADRELTRTVTPLGTGGGTGLRYRVADELDVDLVNPRVTKLPLGDFAADDLSTVAGSNVVTATGATNFLLAGVEVGDSLEILEGDNAGVFRIEAVTASTLTLGANVPNTGFSQMFEVYRAFTGVDLPMVRVKEIELLDSNQQPTGITIPYGKNIDARVAGQFSNRAEGNILTRFTGALVDNGPGLYDLNDPNVDFVAEGVDVGMRLNIKNTSSAGFYTIAAVGSGDGLPDDNTIRVEPVADGGVEFRTTATQVNYQIGRPSAGFVRLYFLEPTSVNIQTGLDGGRIQFEDEGTPKEFRFSPVTGNPIIPAPGSNESLPRDLRVVRSFSVGGGNFNTVVEITDDNRPGVFELEIQEGDLLEVNQQIAFKHSQEFSNTPTGDQKAGDFTWNGTTTVVTSIPDQVPVGSYIRETASTFLFKVISKSGGNLTIANPLSLTIPSSGLADTEMIATLEQLGVFGSPAGLRTIAGSNRVTVPSNSLIDFVAMNKLFPLPGQTITVNSGPDAGIYTIESVEDSKTLSLSSVMTSTTSTVLGFDADARNDADPQSITPSGSNTILLDTTDGSQLGTQIGHYVSIFETTHGVGDGTHEISDITSPGLSVELDLDLSAEDPNLINTGAETISPPDPFSIGTFSWARTDNNLNVEQPFSIYQAEATEAEVVQVATKRDDVVVTRRGDITTNLNLEDPGGFDFVAAGVEEGDILEVLAGPSRGQYIIDSITGGGNDTLVIRNNASNLFPVTLSDVPYRVWGGLHGSRRMLTVGPFESFDGLLEPGESTPYLVRRPGLFRTSSTVMADNFDGTLYYADIQVESMGAGDEFNLDRGTRLVVTSGLQADGYEYEVENNTLTFSTFEEVSLNFDRRFLPVGNSDSPENLTEVSGRNIKVAFESSTPTRLVNDLMRSDRDRPINANPIARHFLPSFVFTQLVYRDGVQPTEVGPEVEDFINNLGAEAVLEVSDLEALITRRGATFVRHPLEIVTVTHDIDRVLVVNRSDNQLGGTESVPFNGTGRISAFFTTLGESLLVERES